MSILIDKGSFKCRVSSVLNKNSKEFGKDNMFDGSDESCWNSHQGSPQSVMIQFVDPLDSSTERMVNISEIKIMFQGGFVGKDCEVLAQQLDSKEFIFISKFFPDDINTFQVRLIEIDRYIYWISFPMKIENVKQIKIVFKQSTDFFGRIVVYKLDILA
ncbi:galactose-binding domain-containing protein [Cavenderia fasciculata]|uniref:Galactose-binding domain-containing protein n=1 Tax=Cavenderia fasciculata TaxID=261658 RepID=F4Q5J8_CACFS|nr:galactose-binding domain-containing protein [Cavenderia fasciculata]EGG17257.1 galactose-binding domain-containing protein [Cavenderia fasciculata]|eukprot:XP_004355741.1 galactose-binding domain-containing protein [Cavenderia fasciculata]